MKNYIKISIAFLLFGAISMACAPQEEKQHLKSQVESLFYAILEGNINETYKYLPSLDDLDKIYINDDTYDSKASFNKNWARHLNTDKASYIKKVRSKLPNEMGDINDIKLDFLLFGEHIHALDAQQLNAYFKIDGNWMTLRLMLVEKNNTHYLFLNEFSRAPKTNKNEIKQYIDDQQKNGDNEMQYIEY